MTNTGTGGIMPYHNRQRYRHLSNDPVYRVIQNIPFGKKAPKISILPNLWVVIPIIAALVFILHGIF
jgi:hypothetical protein